MVKYTGRLASAVFWVALVRCSAISVAGDPTGSAGESCTKKADCASGLACVANLCTASVEATPAEPEPDAEAPATPTGCDGATCDPTWAGNGACERECNCADFSFDGGECQNACTNDSDRGVWDVAGFELQPGDCWQGCAGNPELTTCTDQCLQGLGIGPSCTLCFAVFVDCLASNCGESCVDEPARADCETCSSATCWQAFYTCSGAIATPG